MIFKCLWLHFPFLSLFLYSQTLKADEVTVGSILLVTVLPVLFPSHRTVVAAGWVALQSLYEFQFPFEKLLLSVLPKGGKGAPPWSRAISPGGRAGGKQSGATDQASSGSSPTSPLTWAGTVPMSICTIQTQCEKTQTSLCPSSPRKKQRQQTLIKEITDLKGCRAGQIWIWGLNLL